MQLDNARLWVRRSNHIYARSNMGERWRQRCVEDDDGRDIHLLHRGACLYYHYPNVHGSTSGPKRNTWCASVEGTDNRNVTWDNPSIGTLNNNGYIMVTYTAPASVSTTQYVVLTAHSNQDPSKTASATITLQPAAPTEVPKYVISGTVTQADGSAFGPISINVTGDQAQTVGALPNGTYSIPELPAGHYTVKPSSDYGAATPTTYDLIESRSGNHVMKPFRISPNNVFPPVDESPVESRGVLSVTANGIPKAYDFWWTNSHINSRDIQWPGCWVKPIGSSGELLQQ